MARHLLSVSVDRLALSSEAPATSTPGKPRRTDKTFLLCPGSLTNGECQDSER